MRQTIVVSLLLGVLAFAVVYISETPARNSRMAAERAAGNSLVTDARGAGGDRFRPADTMRDVVGSIVRVGNQALEAESRSIVKAARQDLVSKAVRLKQINAPADQDYGAAVARYALAVDPADPDANYSLGLIYRDGTGVARDDAAAARHLLTAAEHGHAHAQRAIAELYESGRGVRRNAVAAYIWYDSAGLGLRSVTERQAALARRDRLVARMSEAELSAATDLAETTRQRMAALSQKPSEIGPAMPNQSAEVQTGR
ncbi:tetratricopeptide repeat protein [Bauldia litoralis]|uniref:tetratricopeptide repeat protein n=1 Tax=Bauldia litoralis TaxID=665467 RepID=UPI0032666B4B